VIVDSLNSFLEGIEEQLEWHLNHVCGDCPTIQTMSSNLTRVRSGLERLQRIEADGSASEEQIAETLREAGELLVFFGPLPPRVRLSGNLISV
jgi:hypothetical protein